MVSEGAPETFYQLLSKSFVMPKNLFALELILSRLRADKTNGPTVFTFCSVVLKYLRKNFYEALEELDNIASKNLLTLQRKCNDLNQVLEPLKDVASLVEDVMFTRLYVFFVISLTNLV